MINLSPEHLLTIGKFIVSGAGNSLIVYGVTLLFSLPLGILGAIGRLSKFKVIGWILSVYTWIFRGTPLMLQLVFFFYILPSFGIVMDALSTACFTFVVNYTAYFIEIFRAGIQSIERGQYEAAKALGMNRTLTMKRIILPQAVKTILPPIGNEAVTLIKDTALCSVITLPEIMKNANAMIATYAEPSGYLVAAVIYLLMTFVIILLFRMLEKRYAYYEN